MSIYARLRRKIEKKLGDWIINNEEKLLNISFNLMLENEEKQSFSQKVKYYLGKIASKILGGRFWGGVVVPLNYTIESSTNFLPTEEVLEIAKHSKIRAIGDCYCRKKYGDPLGLPLKTCMWFSESTYLLDLIEQKKIPDIDLRIVSLEDIEETLKKCDELGCVHQAIFFPSRRNIYVICNCHPSSCLVLKAYLKHGVKAVVKSNFTISYDREKCVGCHACIERCYFNALKLSTDGKIEVVEENCVGCGLCVSKCPVGALKLVKKRIKS